MDALINDLILVDSKMEESKIVDRYEKEIEKLKPELVRINNSTSLANLKKHKFDPSFAQWRLSNNLVNEEKKCEDFFQQLKQDFLRLNSLVSEANTISDDLQQRINYDCILRIPVSYLKPNERSMDNICELAVEVKQGISSPQIWSVEKFESKLNIMRDIYDQWKISENQNEVLTQKLKRNNPFFEEEFNTFIGVANIYLKALFYDLKIDHIVPIINTQGETSGSLRVVLDQTGPSSLKKLSDLQINNTIRGSLSEGISPDIDEQSLGNRSNSQHSFDDEGIDELSNGKTDQITIKFTIKEARDLPQSIAENVMCRYTFINPKLDQTIYSIKSSDDNDEKKSNVFSFNHENEYTFPISDNFLSTCLDGAISIEVWHQNKSKSQSIPDDDGLDRVRELGKVWKDVKRHIHYAIEIHELDASGEWGPVGVDVCDQIISGGVYRLKQGQSKRVVVSLRVLPRTNAMPFVLHAIRSVEIGSISTRKIDAPRQLDSYQDEDLQCLKREWLNLIEKRKLHLESEVNVLNEQINKTVYDAHREKILLEQLVRLTDERNIAAFPPAGSGIPGSPPTWNLPATIEMHRPLIFLNVNPFNMNTSNDTAGLQTILNEENKTKMIPLSLIQNASDEIRAVAQWDPAVHDSNILNQVTPSDTLIYLIIKVVVILSQPVPIELVLRKRIAVTMNKTEGWWPGKTIKSFLGYKAYKRTSVVYEIVSTIPKAIHNNDDSNKTDIVSLSEDNIRKYIQYASIVDSFLLLDKLRQEVLLAENSAKQQTIRKAASAPNITPQKTITNAFSSPTNPRRKDFNNQLSAFDETELNGSTPSMISRSIFIEEQQLQPIHTPTLRIKHPIDLDENIHEDEGETLEDKRETLEKKYIITPIQRVESSSKEKINNEDYSIGSRVIVNTGHTVVNKAGIIRFAGSLNNKEGTWYGIEFEEPIGKNNGSVGEDIYFKCPDNYGIFTRRDKIRLVD